MAKKAKRKAVKPTRLEELLESYVQARIANHQKGSASPESWPEIEANLIDAQHELSNYLHVVARFATGEGSTTSAWAKKTLDDLRRFPTGAE